MATLAEAQRALGELFIIGFSGLELSEETSAFISQANPPKLPNSPTKSRPAKTILPY
jgi:hypothetical protein